MDLQALLVFVGGFAVCCGFVFLVSIFGAKEQTFEEALAAQRKKNEKEKAKGKKEKKDQGDKKSKPWRKKGKNEREEKVELLDDGEEEQVIVVPSPVIEEPLPVEDPTPEPSPSPTPEPTPEPIKKKKKDKNGKKTRMEIQEVQEIIEDQIEFEPVAEEPIKEEESPVLEEKIEEIVEPVVEEEMVEEVVAAPPVVEVKPSTVKQTKSKKSKGESASNNPKDLLTVVKKTAFSDSEAQQLIDVLLTKQSGPADLNNSEEWIEKGKPSESQKLKMQLNEMEKQLEEEQMKGKSFQDKMAALRLELNQEKSAKASHSRIVEEMNARHGQEVSMVNNKMQGLLSESNLLKGQLSQIQLQLRDAEAMRVQYQATIDSLSGQLHVATTAVATASANDPHIMSELEQLRTLRDKYEASLAEYAANNTTLTTQLNSKTGENEELKSQVNIQNEELMGLRNQVNSEQSKLGGVQAALNSKTDEAQTLTAELARVNNLHEDLKQQHANNTAAVAAADNTAAVEAELATVKAKLGEKETEVAELATVKAKLSEKETEIARVREENERLADQLASSVERPAAEGEEAGAKNDAGVEHHNGDAEGESEEAAKAAANAKLVEEWREKFDSLTVEYNKTLAKQKVLESDFDQQLSSSKTDFEKLQSKNNELEVALDGSKSLLLRLFPCISSTMELPTMEVKAQEYLQDLAKRLSNLQIKVLNLNSHNQSLKDEAAQSEAEDKSEELDKLEGQVAHYKSVLNQTETMLNALQASVEAAEGEWRNKLESAHRELTSLRSENSNLLSRVHASKDSEEMQGKLEVMQKKLGAEEDEKEKLQKKNTELSELLEKEQIEKNELSQSVEKLETSKAELSNTNTKLQQVLATTKEALEKETDLNKSLQLDQASSKGSAATHKSSVKMSYGQLYGARLSQTACPFPDEWMYGSVPENIANDDELD